MRQKERIRNFVENALSESMDVQEQSMVLLGAAGDGKESEWKNAYKCNNSDTLACSSNEYMCINQKSCSFAVNGAKCDNLQPPNYNFNVDTCKFL